MGECISKRDKTPEKEMMPSSSSPDEVEETSEPGSPKSSKHNITAPAPKDDRQHNLNAPAPPPVRKRSMEMAPEDMSKFLTQFAQGSPASPKRSTSGLPSPGPEGGGTYLLPPMSRENQGKRCLVIDLDETLVHTERQPSGFAGGRYDFKISVTIGASTYNMYVAKRPGCDDFLKRAAEHYELVIFTASMEPYCTAVMEKIDPSGLCAHCLHRSHCTFWRSEIYVKDLARLGRDMKDTIILDNNPDCYLFQPENAIPINSWYDDPADMDLEHVMGILDVISRQSKSAVTTLNEIDKRLGWGRMTDT